jgi:hypothetical protein
MTRTEISHCFGRNMSSERIAQALSLLRGAYSARHTRRVADRQRGGMRREGLRIRGKIRMTWHHSGP